MFLNKKHKRTNSQPAERQKGKRERERLTLGFSLQQKGTDRQTHIGILLAAGEGHRQTDRQTDRLTLGSSLQTDRQTHIRVLLADRQTATETGRQTERQTHIGVLLAAGERHTALLDAGGGAVEVLVLVPVVVRVDPATVQLQWKQQFIYNGNNSNNGSIATVLYYCTTAKPLKCNSLTGR